MAPGILERNLTFWGMVGGVMTALKIKDHWDNNYQQIPTDEEGLGHGPVALHSPIDEEAARHASDNLSIDTTLTVNKPKRKRADCCVCCGMKCGLFWKAFGIVCALFLVWQLIQLVIWMVMPKATGLEGMPKYSTSLGCMDADYIYNPDQTIHSIPIGVAKADHSVTIRGHGVGTIVLAEGAADAEDIKLEMILRTNQQDLLEKVKFRYPTIEDVRDGVSESATHLDTPTNLRHSCMRYDIILSIPPTLKELTIKSATVTQLQFAPEAQVNLDSLRIKLQSRDNELSMLVPHANFHAKSLYLATRKGWLVGDVSIINETELDTHLGDAVTNVHVHPFSSSDDADARAILKTNSGNGRTDIFYESDRGAPHRPIMSTHTVASPRNGDVYLTYKNAEFSGHVNVKAKSYSASGVHDMFNRTGTALPWVGDENGGDMLVTESASGWVGLYF